MRSLAIIGALAVATAAPLSAQGSLSARDVILGRRSPSTVAGQVLGQGSQSDATTRKSNRIPPGQLPPAGMCRIWIDGVPPGQQPAPTDCQTAVATKPANARVIWGDESAFPGQGNGKFNKQKSGKQKNKVKRDGRDDDDDDRFDIGINDERNGRKSVARRGRKG